MLIQGLSTLGGLVLSIQCTMISMEAFPLYKSIGPIVANFFQEHITYQYKITSNKWSSIHWSTIISSRGNPTHPLQTHGSPMHPLQSHGSPTHYTIGIMVVLCITLLESLQRHHQSCSDLTLGGFIFYYLFERTTHRSTWRPVAPPIKSRLLL